MTISAGLDGSKLMSRSSIPLMFDVNIGLVVDDVLDASILKDKWAQLIEHSPLLGGVLQSEMDTRQFRCGLTVDFHSRTMDSDLRTFLPFSWHGRKSPSILNDDTTSVDKKFMFSACSHPKRVCKMRTTILNDATLLCFSFVHGLFDGQSCFEIIHFFCDLLSENPIPKFSLPPDVAGVRMSDLVRVSDTTAPAPPDPKEDVFITSRLDQLKVVGKVTYQKIVDLLGLSETLTDRLVHLPGPWVDAVRARAQEELECKGNYSGVQLTRNNIITALYLKMVYTPRGTSDGPVRLVGPISYRALIDRPQDGSYYPHNTIMCLRCSLTEHEVRTDSIAQLAEKLRLATIRYSHPAAVKREVQAIEDKVLAPAAFPIKGTMKWSSPFVTPWTTFNYADLDFSGASASRRGRKPSILFVNPHINLIGGSLASLFLLLMKDLSGGYWLRGSNTASGWAAFDDCVSMKTLFSDD